MFEISENLFENFNKSEEQGQKEKNKRLTLARIAIFARIAAIHIVFSFIYC